MRHGNKNKHLGRTMEHRQAMFANMSNSLIEHKRIETTLQKAKALRKYFEPLVTRARENTTHSRRIVFGHLQSKEAIKELFGPIAEAVGDRPGGYVRIIRTGFRHGDAAEMALIELVDFNPDYNGQAKAGDTSKGKKRRTRRGGGTAKAATTAAVAAAPVIAEVAEEDMIAVGEIAEEAAEAAESNVAETTENDTEAPAKDEE
ncbi:MAG: 50S ribosomal protein L17 [Saprospiraceae bacterium]|nr:50S ribosomal protein L17 [Saprospiraceae bacterium]